MLGLAKIIFEWCWILANLNLKKLNFQIKKKKLLNNASRYNKNQQGIPRFFRIYMNFFSKFWKINEMLWILDMFFYV